MLRLSVLHRKVQPVNRAIATGQPDVRGGRKGKPKHLHDHQGGSVRAPVQSRIKGREVVIPVELLSIGGDEA